MYYSPYLGRTNVSISPLWLFIIFMIAVIIVFAIPAKNFIMSKFKKTNQPE